MIPRIGTNTKARRLVQTHFRCVGWSKCGIYLINGRILIVSWYYIILYYIIFQYIVWYYIKIYYIICYYIILYYIILYYIILYIIYIYICWYVNIYPVFSLVFIPILGDLPLTVFFLSDVCLAAAISSPSAAPEHGPWSLTKNMWDGAPVG